MSTYYVTESGSGAQNGSNLANAWSVGDFNTSSNWSASIGTVGKISPADTVILNGTISTALNTQGNGSAGNPITILFDIGAKISAPVWGNGAGGINVTHNYITIDGGAGSMGGISGNPSTANGIIECTANGTSLANQVTCGGVVGTNALYLTVKNLVISNIYVRTGTVDQNAFGVGVQNEGPAVSITGFVVTNCIIHDACYGILADGGDTSNGYTISNNTIYNINWGVRIATRGGSSNLLQNLLLYNNLIYGWTIWDDTTISNSFHHNGIFLQADGGLIDGASLYNNKFGPGFGGSYQTSAIYFNTGIKNVRIFNNIFFALTGEFCSNGMIVGQTTQITTISIYNNTFLNDAGISLSISGSNSLIPGSDVAQTWNVKNNVGSTSGGYGFISVHYSPGITFNCNYNIGYGYTYTLNPYDFSTTGSANTMTFAAWQALGYDQQGSNANPQIDLQNGTLQTNSPARNAAENLTSLNITALNFDAIGNPRPTVIAWDTGALQFIISSLRRLGRRPKLRGQSLN